MGIRVLVIGGNGFLGKELSRKCVELNWEVDVAINKSNNDVVYGIKNIINSKDLKNQKDKNYAYIFNVAAFIPYGAYDQTDERLIDSNISLNIDIHKFFQGSKIIYASSVSVYGSYNGIIKEDSKCIDPEMYGLSKLAGELIVSHHPVYSIIRFSSLYGNGMYNGTFIPKLINDAKDKKLITLLGTGEREQNYLHIRDGVQYCIHAALNGKNEVYLGVSQNSYKNIEVANIIAKNIEDCEIRNSGIDSSSSYIYDNKHTLNILEFAPLINLEKGIKEMIDA